MTDDRWLCDLPDDGRRAKLAQLRTLLESEGVYTPDEIESNLERALTQRVRDLPV